MLRLDNNKYIETIYDKSVELNYRVLYGEGVYNGEGSGSEADRWDRLKDKCETEAQDFN